MKKLLWILAALTLVAAVIGVLWVREFRAEMKAHHIGFSGAEDMFTPFAKELTAPFTGSK